MICDRQTDRQTDGQTDARGKTICLPTLKGGDIITQMIQKRRPPWNSQLKYFTGGLKPFHSANLTYSSDVDQDT